MLVVKPKYKGKGIKVSVRRTPFKMVTIDLDIATEPQLKMILDAGLPYVSDVKENEEKKEKKKA